MNWLNWARVFASDLWNLRTKVNAMSTAQDNLTAAVKSAEDRLDGVAAAQAGLRATVAALQARIDAMPNPDAKDQAFADELNAHVAAFDAANPPAVPVVSEPVSPPA